MAELEKTARELGRSMAQVAVNWAANRPGVATVILGATKLSQLEDNLGALDFEIPAELGSRLDAASVAPVRFPYMFFTPGMQAMLTSGARIGDKPPGYSAPVLIEGAPAGVT